MIADLQPYAEYKESGSKWLGAVPANWEVRNLHTLISKRAERDRADLPLLSVAREKGVFIRSLTDVDENHNVIPEDLSNYKVARAGNLVINKMKAWQGSMGIAPCDGIVSPAYFVFEFRIANHAFGQRLLRSKPYVAHFGQASDGVRVGQWDLSIPGMRQIPVLVPPHAEQAAIVRFLDWANMRLERAIRAKRKVIVLLNEQKQAIIHRAVTRGFDPSAPLKPSGIPWLGDIPQHWETRRLRHACEMRVSNVDKHTKQGENPVRLCNYVEVYKHERIRESTQFMAATATEDERIRFGLRKGDVLITKDSEQWNDIGVPALVECEAPDLVCGYHLAILRSRPGLHGTFLHRVLQSRFIATQFHIEANGVTRYGLSHGAIQGVAIPLPPIAQQHAIAAFLDRETGQLDTAISRLEREIELLREYRTRLVADVVTGKLDVREAAARLPEEPAADSVKDDNDLGDDEDAKLVAGND